MRCACVSKYGLSISSFSISILLSSNVACLCPCCIWRTSSCPRCRTRYASMGHASSVQVIVSAEALRVRRQWAVRYPVTCRDDMLWPCQLVRRAWVACPCHLPYLWLYSHSMAVYRLKANTKFARVSIAHRVHGCLLMQACTTRDAPHTQGCDAICWCIASAPLPEAS